MSRKLIDGDRLKKEIHENDIMGGLNYAWYIDHAELVDAVEVAHGRWVESKSFEERLYGRTVCSVCGEPFDKIVINNEGTFLMPIKTNFCPNCGAKMEVKHESD